MRHPTRIGVGRGQVVEVVDARCREQHPGVAIVGAIGQHSEDVERDDDARLAREDEPAVADTPYAVDGAGQGPEGPDAARDLEVVHEVCRAR